MLTTAQVEAYHRDGYLVLPNVIPPTTLARLQALTDTIARQAQDAPGHTDVYDVAEGHQAGAPRLRRIKLPHKVHPEYRAFAADTVITNLLAQLLGPDIRLHGGKVNLKSGSGGEAIEWHQDWAFYPHTNDDVLAVGVMLDDMDEDNGPLLLMPRTHTGPIFDHHIDGRFAGGFHPASAGLDTSDVATVTGKAGSISIHHARLVHGSAANRSDRPRRLLLWEYTAADAWPLAGVPDFDEFNDRVVRGSPTIAPRMTEVPIRMPLPPAIHQGSIFENQRISEKRYFDKAA